MRKEPARQAKPAPAGPLSPQTRNSSLSQSIARSKPVLLQRHGQGQPLACFCYSTRVVLTSAAVRKASCLV